MCLLFHALALPENQSELLGGTLQPKLEPLPQHPKIKAYFNYNQADVYTDPYRQIERYGNDLEKQIIAQINLAQQLIDIAV